jgi:hypothetical protein
VIDAFCGFWYKRSMPMRLKQIYLTEAQARAITLRALREHKPKSQVIRELITRGLQAARLGKHHFGKDTR